MFTSPITQQTDFTAEEVRMRPEEGRMYIFPGWLEHGVEANENNEDRVRFSFNVRAIPLVIPSR